MGTREGGSWPLNVAVFTGLLVIACSGQDSSAPPDDLLQFLVEKNEAAWQKIQSLTSMQYTVQREWLDRRSQRPFHATGQFKQEGKRLWSTYSVEARTGPMRVVRERELPLGDRVGKMQMLEPDPSAGRTAMTERRIVVNDQYVAGWPARGNPFAYRWDHNSVDTMSEKTRMHLQRTLPPDLLASCFGEDRRRFPEAVQTASDRRRYDAVELPAEDGRRLYQIRRFYPPEAPKPDVIWVIDPQKGFLATEKVFHAQREVPVRHRKMHVKEVAPGIWYPLGYEEARFAEPNQPGESPRVATWSKIALTDVRVNEPIPDGQFDIEALGLLKDQPDITVLRTTVDGRTIPYGYREGKLVPKAKE